MNKLPELPVAIDFFKNKSDMEPHSAQNQRSLLVPVTTHKARTQRKLNKILIQNKLITTWVQHASQTSSVAGQQSHP